MQNRYKQLFSRLQRDQQHAFVPFTVLGWPTPERCFETIKCMIDSGASALELGVAFSDPVADGPTIQEAAFRTIDSGFTVPDAFALIEKVRAYKSDIPIGILTYYNVVLARGCERFYREAAQAGVDSVLIADLPPEAADEVLPHAQRSAVAQVFIISPMTDDDRLQRVAKISNAYIYVVSRLGITGTEQRHDDQLQDLLARARRVTQLPLLVGFGISSPEQVPTMVASGADGVICGSKIVEIIKQESSADYQELNAFIQRMASPIKERVNAN